MAGERKNFGSCGQIVVMALVFGLIFLTLLGGVVGFLALQARGAIRQVAWRQSLEIAEAGVNYYKWRFAHNPEDWQQTTSLDSDYKDPQGDIIGHWHIEITPPDECSTIVKITSTGWTNDFPQITRTLSVRYGKPSFAKYSFITNSDVWFGQDEEVVGPLHGNGGIRMDGEQNSLFTSTKETYQCTPTFGCSAPYEIKPGIWGSGEGGEKGLWQFPVPEIDFNVLSVDLAQIKSYAQQEGLYLPPSGSYGYHIVLGLNGQVNVYKVTRLKSSVWGYDMDGWVRESSSIDRETFYTSYDVPTASCGKQNLIFVEDKAWVDGEYNYNLTVAAARFPDTPQTNASIVIQDDLTSPSSDKGSLALIAQKNILVPLYSPDNLEIDAIMIAQKGHIFRYYYPWWYSYSIRDKIEVKGSIITNQTWTWTWVDSSGDVVSGYRNTESSYDSSLVYNPPPFLPTTGQYDFISWEEIE